MTPTQALEAAAIALCEAHREEPNGEFTNHRMIGHTIKVRKRTYLEIAKEDARTVLNAAVPGFLSGHSEPIQLDNGSGG